MNTIKRRDFLKVGTGMAMVPMLGSSAGSKPLPPRSEAAGAFPDWANAQIDEAVARFKALKFFQISPLVRLGKKML